ncbi:hypothetical protein [Lysinibacillus fusiformis]|uniref:hypothetical protein n=1 Tax=Lysinibacillus fusiformis TaxID=28031 RepID=UPI003D01394C
MACTKGYVTTGASQPVINTCVSTDSKNVYVTLEGLKTETWPFQGYVRFKLKRAGANEVWVDVSTQNGGYWENSSKANKNFTFSNIGYKGDVMVVEALFYANSNYTGLCSSSASHMFVR